jgi:hypothetical protein
MAAITTYDVVGIKEDISDIITNIDPTKTPFQTLVGAGEKVNNTLFQWQEDKLAAPNTSNAAADGADATDASILATTMRSNYTQILTKTVKMAHTTDAVSRYGRAKELAYQLAKFSKELKRDLEAIVLSGQAAVAGSAGVARKLAGYQAMIDTNLRIATGNPSNSPSEAQFLSTLQALYVNGVDPEVVMLPPAESIVLAGFASASGRTRFIPNAQGQERSTVVNVVDLYVSPFGEVKSVLNRFQLTTDWLIFDPEMWSIPTLRPWSRQPLARVGDAEREMIVGEYSLKHKNFKASAVIRKVTGAGGLF